MRARGRNYHDGRNDESPGAVQYGHNFAEQWERAIEKAPAFVFVTGWNQWFAGNLPKSVAENIGETDAAVFFCDTFNQVNSSDIEPMKGGHGDNYYYQMVNYIVRSYEHEVDPGQLIDLHGAYCTYLARTLISPEDRSVHVVIGNTDPFQLFVNGERIGESEERLMWMPFNHAYLVPFRKGPNTLLIKLLRYGDGFRFTLGLRPAKTELELQSMNCANWNVDMADAL